MGAYLSTKKIVFIALMASLGNVLSLISIQLSPIVPSIPLGMINFSLALDLSHLATFIAALFGGPLLGGLTGLIGGMVAAFQFGFSQGNPVTGFGLPVGKALTGFAAGIVMKRLSPDRNLLRMVMSTVIAYVPEGLFTVFIFMALYPPLFHLHVFVATTITIQILVKAFVEMILMGIILGGIARNRSFTDYMKASFKQQ